MLFLASLLFAAVLYAIPGVLLLLLLTKLIHLQVRPVPESLIFFILSGLLYSGILLLIRYTQLHLMSWRERDADKDFILREILDVRQFKWINFWGLAVTSTAMVILLIRGSLPYPYFPLFAATLVGLLSIRGKTALIPLEPIYPDPRYNDDLFDHFQDNQSSPTPQEDKSSDEHKEEEESSNGENGNAPPEPSPPKVTKRELSWRLSRDSGNLSFKEAFELTEASYSHATSVQRYPRTQEDYIRYPIEGAIPEIRRVAFALREITIANRLSSMEEVQSIINMVRQIPYVSDMETHNVDDYCNFPIETLYEVAGDCEDHAVLAACLLHILGHDVALFYLDLGSSAHLALGYQTSIVTTGFSVITDGGANYCYVETVPRAVPESGIDIGDISYAFLSDLKSAEVWPLPQNSV